MKTAKPSEESNMSNNESEFCGRIDKELKFLHKTGYYNLTAIIQALAFTNLTEEATELSGLPCETWIFAFSTLMLIIIVWNGYVRTTVQSSYPPKLLDALIPFLIGVAECVLIDGIGHPTQWYFGLAALAFIGWGAYENWKRNISKETPPAPPIVFWHCNIHQLSCSVVFMLSMIFVCLIDYAYLSALCSATISVVILIRPVEV